MIFLKELKRCLYELSIIDDSLDALGASKKYQRLRNWIIRIIIGWYYFFIQFNNIISFSQCIFRFILLICTVCVIRLSRICQYLKCSNLGKYHQVIYIRIHLLRNLLFIDSIASKCLRSL
ncbi:hypothetical protein ALC60_06392 [Trachymyrmex zeteki]|uniref:Uncharacterized protein n=1 Tax=Mycetomoellerius zeteki TaxID=64791 RepID=A0A151X3G1_9HYME|nr:hypothetical protein ALC60_06392 [Trachymyrmex zeteki]